MKVKVSGASRAGRPSIESTGGSSLIVVIVTPGSFVSDNMIVALGLVMAPAVAVIVAPAPEAGDVYSPPTELTLPAPVQLQAKSDGFAIKFPNWSPDVAVNR